jgi:hypothetical protein
MKTTSSHSVTPIGTFGSEARVPLLFAFFFRNTLKLLRRFPSLCSFHTSFTQKRWTQPENQHRNVDTGHYLYGTATTPSLHMT